MSSASSKKRLEPTGGKTQLTLPFVKITKSESNDQPTELIINNKSGSELKTESREENKGDHLPTNANKSPKKSVFLDKWKVSYPWLRFDSDKNLMYCEWCEDYSKDQRINGKLIENNMIRGTSNFRASTLTEHLLLKDHDLARDNNEVKKNKNNTAASINQQNQPTIASIFHSNKEKLKFELMVPLFKNIYFIAKEDLALLKFESLNDLCLSHGLEFNENYRNRKAGKEMMEAISRTIREKLTQDISESEYFGLALDTSMDVSSTENLVITIRYIDKKTNQVCEKFFKLLSIKEKNADFIYQTLITFLNSNSLMNKMIGISTDGEKAIASQKNGVIGKFLKLRPYLIFSHCVCHRIALGAKDLVKEFPYLHVLNKLIYNVCSFLNGSEKRVQILKETEVDDLNLGLRIIKPLDVRWLSNLDAMERLLDLYESVINTFTEVIAKDKDSYAIGIPSEGVPKKKSQKSSKNIFPNFFNILGEHLQIFIQKFVFPKKIHNV